VTKVSVLIPSYNYARYLRYAITSVLSQSYSDLELIIVDDCSTDGSKEIAEEWKRVDDRVVTVYHKTNCGLAATRNSGLAISSGEFIALCDADDIWREDKLKIQLHQFRQRPELGVVHSDSAIIDGNGKLTGERFSGLFHRKGQVTSGRLFEELCQRNFLCVPTVVLRREALQYAGGFDACLRSLEDWVCWTKVAKRYPFYYVDAPLVQYRIHGAGLSSNSRNMAHNRVKALRVLLDTVLEIPTQTRSRMLYSLGMSHLETGDSRSAYGAFVDSIKANPAQVRSWVRCSQSVLKLALSRPL
jgi:teichuronic acid biosynthesis glycosyltransferase TuaG